MLVPYLVPKLRRDPKLKIGTKINIGGSVGKSEGGGVVIVVQKIIALLDEG